MQNTPFYPSTAILSLWQPLLAHFQALHPSLLSVLATQIISRISSAPEPIADSVLSSEIISLDVSESSADFSYDLCLAAWLNWLVDTWGVEGEEFIRGEMVVALMSALSPGRDLPPTNKQMRV